MAYLAPIQLIGPLWRLTRFCWSFWDDTQYLSHWIYTKRLSRNSLRYSIRYDSYVKMNFYFTLHKAAARYINSRTLLRLCKSCWSCWCRYALIYDATIRYRWWIYHLWHYCFTELRYCIHGPARNFRTRSDGKSRWGLWALFTDTQQSIMSLKHATIK